MTVRMRGLLRAMLPFLLLTTAGAEMAAAQSDPLLTTWFTQNSGRYARVVETTGGTAVTTWPSEGMPNMGGGQSQPAYSDVQQIGYSSGYVYINGTGLASHQMGPWYNSLNTIFGNWPSNQNYIRRFPRNPQAAVSKTTNGLGPLGLWVNGVALFNLLDGASYSTTKGMDVGGPGGGQGDGIWVRNAVIVEAPTFDASNAHQPPSGEYHYHENPLALRYQLGDNVAYDSSSNHYSEDTTQLHHSPILGWSFDGYPVYGPYGYSDPAKATSSVRRMVSGFVIRDGNYGTTNLAQAGRHTLAPWAASLHGLPQQLDSTQYGPNVSTQYTLGRYCEDYDYLGDHGYTQGTDFDLDMYNGRFCVTPEFPNGTYAYFVTLDSAGNGAFPYVVGRQWYGVPSGGAMTSLPETITISKVAGPNSEIKVQATTTAQGKQLQWTSVEGGHYQVQGSNDGKTWTTLAPDVASQGLTTVYSFTAGSPAAAYIQYQVTLTSLDPYDSTGVHGGSGLGGVGTGVGQTGLPVTHTSLLWTQPNGQISLWSVASSGTFTSHQYGPYAGWTAIALATGSDGIGHILWTQANGQISVWNVASSGAFTSHQYGPYAGWSAAALSVGPDGHCHLLWNKAGGTFSLWNLNSTSGTFTSQQYGPFAGWTGKSVATGPDNYTDVLRINTSGQVSGWRVAPTGSSYVHSEYGPYSGWKAISLSVGPDNKAYPLWTKTDNHAALWTTDFGASAFTSFTYGPFSGWTAIGDATGADGVTHLLWDNTSGQVSLWSVASGGTFTSHAYGPYTGWTAKAISVGP